MPARQRLKVVAQVALQHVRLQQRVTCHTAKRDAVVGQHVAVVLEVLADLGVVGFEPALQPRQRLVEGQLVRRAGVAVRQRDVAGVAGLGAQRDADQLGGHGVEAGGLGVDGDGFILRDAGQPVFKLGSGEDAFVGGHRRALRRGGAFAGESARIGCGVSGRPNRHGATPRQASRASPFPSGDTGFARLAAVQRGQCAAHLVARIDLAQLFDVRWLSGDLVQRHRQRDIATHGDQLAPKRQKVEVLTQVLADHPRDLRRVGDHAIQRAMCLQPFHSRLGPAFLDPRHAIHGVAHQRKVVDDAFRPDTELGLHRWAVEHLTAHGVDPEHVVVDKLGEVLVAGGYDSLPASRRCPRGERADHVIGLHAIDHEQRPAQRAHCGMDRLDLRGEVLRHRGPVRLVLGVEVVAEGLALGVEHHRPVRAGVLTSQTPQHVDDAMQRSGRLASASAQVGQRVVGAVEVGGAVDEKKGGHDPIMLGRRGSSGDA